MIDTLEAVTSLRPERLALFGYAHVPWMKSHQRLIKNEDLPGPEVRFAQARAAEAFLAESGWTEIGLDHFALPHDDLAAAHRAGRLRRNFQGYVTDEAPTLIGLGASAISRTPLGHVQNTAVERDWRAAIGAGNLASHRGVVLSDQDRLIGEAIERLMCDLALDTPELLARHAIAHEGATPPSLGDLSGRLQPFVEDGLIRIDTQGRLSVTPRGRPFVRAVCAAFDPHAQPRVDSQQKRHARVI
jgi:oxygen-independent coproporphyrinogen-3 oxidase